MNLGDSFDWWADVFTAAGLVVAVVGAAWAAKSVILTEDDAIEVGLARHAGETREENLQQPHVQSLLASSRGARIGLWILVVGTLLQLIPVAIRIINSLI